MLVQPSKAASLPGGNGHNPQPPSNGNGSGGVKPEPTNGNGGRQPTAPAKPARISTARWQAAAQALAARCPVYSKPDGQPDYHAMTKVAAEHNFAEISDANLTVVLAALEQAAQDAVPA